MGAIGQLDHDHADIAHHCEQHLAEALGLSLFTTLELDLVELADAVDEFGNLLAKLLRDFRLGGAGVFHDVVENGRNQCLRVHAQVGEQACNSYRMSDVGLAGAAPLSVVRAEGELVCLLDAFDVSRRQVLLEFRNELIDAYRASPVRQQAAQRRRDVHRALQGQGD